MSILILSDTHGMTKEVQEVVDRHQVELILHAGDFCTDKCKEPFSRMQLVRGNCDSDREIPEEQKIMWRDLQIYQTHGHLFGVKSSLLRLHYRAEEMGANLVVFGHSHFPVCSEERGILFINPGSLQMPRGFSVPTYAIISQKEAMSDAVDVEVTFYDTKGSLVKERGGIFRIRR